LLLRHFTLFLLFYLESIQPELYCFKWKDFCFFYLKAEELKKKLAKHCVQVWAVVEEGLEMPQHQHVEAIAFD
jgi:hypothetical protein